MALDLASRQILRRSLVAVALVAAAGLVLGSAVLLLAPDRSSDALAVNVAGRQRMLSQRMAGAAMLAAAGDEAATERLVTAWEQFDDAHRALRTGDGALGITRPPDPALVDAYARPGGLDDQVRRFGDDVAVVLAGGQDPTGSVEPTAAAALVDAAVARITAAAAGPLLADLDEAVAIDQRAGEDRSAAAATLTWVAIGLLVAVLAAATTVVFRPLSAELRRSIGIVRETEREAERRADWHTRFAGIAAHELRTPVTVVAGLSETLNERWDDLDGDLRRDVVDRIARQGKAMTGLVDELSLVAGLAASPMDDTEWRLGDIVDVLVDTHDVVVEVAATQSIRVDRRRLELVLRELVDNAQRHGSPPVAATVTTTTGGAVVVEVSDGGPGVAADTVQHLLTPFTRGTEVVNHTSSDGTGIGLALVAGIAAEVGGVVEQDADASGCTWRVVFPDGAPPAS